MKKVIFTIITGDYENLIDPTFVNKDFDYICFTDFPNIVNTIWQIRPIPKELQTLSKVKQQRIIKICPHKYLPEYDLSVYVDASIDIIGDINILIDREITSNKSVYIPQHPRRKCIYSEVNACLQYNKDVIENIQPQIDRYKKENFPIDFGLVQTGIIIRKHNSCYCIKLMDLWADEVLRGSHRDQLSFNYCLWKLGSSEFQYLNKDLFNSEYFKLYNKHNRVCKQCIIYKFSHFDDKPLCVLGSMQNDEGRKIESKMLFWIEKNYNVVIVRHDGTQFEYPALFYAKKLSVETGRPVLYLHTRGAVNTWKTTIPTRRMWKDQFTNYKDKYFDFVDNDIPSVAAPFIDYSSKGLRTTYNGFVANSKAWEAADIQPDEDRMVFEHTFRNIDNLNVKGLLIQSNHDYIKEMRKFLYKHYK